ncbi:MAG: tetratricopeptide repeat protein [Phormidesmis sp.]
MSAPLLPEALAVLTQLGILPKYIRQMPPGHRRTQCRALINWLTRYRPPQNSNNLTQVKGYIQAAQHLCDIQEWERAFTLLCTRPNTPTQEMLHYQLKLWGYNTVRTDLYRALAARTKNTPPDGWNARMLQFLGESLFSQNQYSQAAQYYQQSLEMFRAVGEPIDVGLLLGALGDVYYAKGDYDSALSHHQQFLRLAHEANLSFAEGIALGSLGNLYESKGEYALAKDYHQQHLAIARQIQDREMEGAALGNLGSCCYSLGEFEKAIDLHHQHLTRAQQIGHRQGESNALGGLGSAYLALNDSPNSSANNSANNNTNNSLKAEQYFIKQKEIAKEIGDLRGEAGALSGLGSVCFGKGDYEQAITYHQKHLDIAQTLGHKEGSLHALCNLGNAYSAIGDYANAAKRYRQQLAIAQELKDLTGEAIANDCLGAVASKASRETG